MDSTQISRKILRLMIFFGVIGYFTWHNYHTYGTFDLATLVSASLLASLAYLLLIGFGFLVRVSGNYLIGLIALIIVSVLAWRGMMKLEINGLISDQHMPYIIMAIGVAFVIFDIVKITRQFKANRLVSQAAKDKQPIRESADINYLPKVYVTGPEALPLAAQQLKEKLGREVSLDELLQHVEYINEITFKDTEAISK